jgi:maltose O-acetyltransferase
MNIILAAYRYIQRKIWQKMCSRYYLARARFYGKVQRGVVEMGSVIANVPIRTDGRGRVKVCDQVTLGYRPAVKCGNGEILLQARGENSYIEINSGTSTSNNVAIVAMQAITIGRNCLIGDNVMITDCDFHNIDPKTRHDQVHITKPVDVGDNVWLGSRVIVLKGVAIGRNSVIAAGSVVTRSIPPNVIAAGSPARVIRSI